MKKWNKGKLIVFLGQVGVGKSTVIRNMLYALKARGLRVSTTSIKSFHVPSYLLWIFMVKILRIRSKYSPWFAICRTGRIRLAKTLVILSTYVDALLVIPIKLIKINLLRIAKHYILSEEYVHSTLFDYIYSYTNLGINNNIAKAPLNILNTLLNRHAPDETVVLMVRSNELRRRWASRGYGDPQLRYVMLQKKFLSMMTKDSLVLDTTNLSVDETVEILIGRVI